MSNVLKHSVILIVFTMVTLLGCANYEVNTKRGNVPGYYIRTEMQEADRAIEAARQAGKDKDCPVEFKAAEDARNNAYDVFRACHTEEGAALAKEATAKANALCPAKPEPVAEQKVIIIAPEPKVEEKVMVAATEPKVIVLAFEDIHFNFDKSTLTPEAQTLLKKNIQLLKDNPGTKVRIAGYTSASGTE